MESFNSKECPLFRFRSERSDIPHLKNYVQGHHLGGGPNCPAPTSMAVVRLADQLVERVPLQMMDGGAIAARFHLDLPSRSPSEY